ncbi:MAG: hypothetical protein PVG39_00790 [Desulfobacteraceae bacterium]|jgi:hypothetical protein
MTFTVDVPEWVVEAGLPLYLLAGKKELLAYREAFVDHDDSGNHVISKRYVFTKDHRGFRGFMNFRWGGREAQYNKKGEYTGHKTVNLWTIGWTDGKKCFLTDIDFYTGEKVKEYDMPVVELKQHIHPAIADRVYGKGIWAVANLLR